MKENKIYVDMYFKDEFLKSSYFITKIPKITKIKLMYFIQSFTDFKERYYLLKIVIFPEGEKRFQSFQSNYVCFTSNLSSK